MILTKKQETGLKIALQRFADNEKYTVISGYAGSGKSTLVRFIIEALDIEEDRVCFATFTGKAAQVLEKKGNKNVSTLHKLLYMARPLPNGSFKFIPKSTIDYDLVIVDEVSMAPLTLMNLLFSHNVHVICLGDPFQLPTIDPDQDNHLLEHPHIFLDEIMRQAKDSEIIRLSMDIRDYKKLEYFNGSDVKVIPKNMVSTGMMKWADQILVATNKTRIEYNKIMRELNGIDSPYPQEGDKLICLRNYWDDIATNDHSCLINGTIGYLHNPFQSKHYLPYYLKAGSDIDVTLGNFISDSGGEFHCAMDTKMIQTGEKCVSPQIAYKLNKNPKTKGIVPKEFTYGYAITGHKSQGSEWPHVLAIEEKFPFSKIEHARWLYTVATRAEDKLVLAIEN